MRLATYFALNPPEPSKEPLMGYQRKIYTMSSDMSHDTQRRSYLRTNLPVKANGEKTETLVAVGSAEHPRDGCAVRSSKAHD